MHLVFYRITQKAEYVSIYLSVYQDIPFIMWPNAVKRG